MKLSLDERIDLRPELSKFLLLIIIFSDFSFSQIPFKGFCKLTSFEVDSGYTRLFSFNYDQDEYSDLLVYNPQGTKAKLYHGQSGLNFNFIKDISFPLQPSRIEPIILQNKIIDEYAFTSRKSRSFGIYKFSKQDNPQLVNQIKFNSYPEHISLEDIDNDGYPEFLLSGNSFEGLSVINRNGNKLEENKILENMTFLNAQFIDLNNDEIKDVVALNSVDNTLHFLYNNGRAEFTEQREINVNENVLSLRVFDLNYDSFPDIIISTTQAIKIYFGDAVIPYHKIISIDTPFEVNNFVIGDFNRDGFFDFNCLSISDGLVFTIFAKDFYSFYPEMLNVKIEDGSDIIPFFSKFVYGSAFINKTGKINILSNVTSLSDNQTLALGAAPNAISKFDLTDNGITDLMFIDDYDQSIKFIIRNAAGFPEKLFTVSLNDNHNKIIEFNNSKTIKTFFCFTTNKRIIESIEIDFEKFTYKHNYFYADGSIEDLVIYPDNAGNAELFILYSKNKSLNFEIYSKTSLRYSNKIYKDISYDWLSPSIVSAKEMLIGYWSINNGSINFSLANLNGNNYEFRRINKIKYGDYSIVSESNNPMNYRDNVFVSLISGKDRVYLLSANNNYEIYSQLGNKYGFRITNKNQLFFDKTNLMFVNDSAEKTFYKLLLVSDKKQLIIKKVFEDITISNFIIANLDQRNYHLVYTDNNFIRIKKLPK